MWIGKSGEVHVLHTPLWPALGPVLRHRLSALPLARLRALSGALTDDGLDLAALLEDVHRDRAGAGRPAEEDEARFRGVPLPQHVRLEVGEDVAADRLAERLVVAVRDLPSRWRPDVVIGLEDVIRFLERRRPVREHRDTLWRRYGARHRGRRHHGRSAGRRRGR